MITTKQLVTKNMIEAFGFLRTGHDLPYQEAALAADVQQELVTMEQIATRLPMRLITKLTELFDRMSKKDG